MQLLLLITIISILKQYFECKWYWVKVNMQRIYLQQYFMSLLYKIKCKRCAYSPLSQDSCFDKPAFAFVESLLSSLVEPGC